MMRQNRKIIHFFSQRKILPVTVICFFMVSGLMLSQAMATVESTYVYSLSNFSGKVPFNWASISVDELRNEVYVVDPEERNIRVFNERGMEIYRFGDDGSLGNVINVAVEKDGSILVLTQKISGYSVILCDFRGEPLAEFNLKNIPADFSGFTPERLVYRNGLVYLVDPKYMRVIVTDDIGGFIRGYNIRPLLDAGAEKNKLEGAEFGGFNVDGQGNILFTIPEIFLAFILSPDGEIKNFGSAGSAPGKFSLIGGITSDDLGYIYVADRGKNVIIVFDKELQFQVEFGYRGARPENLIGPENLGFQSRGGMLYVSQLRNRGISVFRMEYR
jgi:DNA-binding beta-propeller fold protein YncE